MKLKRGYAFWLQSGKADRQSYDCNLVHLDNFHTVQDFWNIYQFLCRPSNLGEGGQLFLFQENVKPLWEDPANINGGRFLFRVKNKYQIDRLWEELIINYLGDQFNSNDLISGLIVHQKKNFILISIWIKATTNQNKEQIDQWLNDVLGVSDKNNIEYQDHPKSEDLDQLDYAQ